MEEENKKFEFKAGKEVTFGKLTFVVDKPIKTVERIGKQADTTYDDSLKQLADAFSKLSGKKHHVTLTIPDKIEGASFKSKIRLRIEALNLSDKMHVESSTKRDGKKTIVSEVRIHKGRKLTADEKAKEKAEKKKSEENKAEE
jgi:hypothetical protein